jgi:inosose dehydratase
LFTSTGYGFDEAVLLRALRAITAAGFDGLAVEIPSGMAPSTYRGLLQDHNLSPAPGYFSMTADGSMTTEAVVDLARQHAELHLELGLGVSFLAANMSPARIQLPAQGASHDASTFDRIIRLTEAVAEAMSSLGVTPAIHQHVGSWIESGEELEAVLEKVPSDLLAFGPDTGHLYWAGIDPQSVVRRHRDRVVAVHLKDVHAAVVKDAADEDLDYVTATLTHNLWTEPGRGDAGISGVIDELNAVNFDGWYIVEVDRPDFADAEESVAYSGTWARDVLRASVNSPLIARDQARGDKRQE